MNPLQNPRKNERELVKSLIHESKIKKPPIPVEEIAEALGAKVIYSPSEDGQCGMIFVEDGETVIGVNSLHHPNRQRFTIAHEIGHLMLHGAELSGKIHIDRGANSIRFRRDQKSSLGEDIKEIQANRFAAELLMPYEMLKKEIQNKFIDIEDEDLMRNLAKKYHVSVQAMSIRISEAFSEILESQNAT